MIGRAELEVHPGVIAVGIAGVVLPLRVAAVTDPDHADVEVLRLVGTVSVALEADLVLVGGAREEGVPNRLPARAQQRSIHLGRLSRLVVGEVGVVTVHAFGMAGGAGSGLGKGMQRRGRALRFIVY